MRVNTTFDWVVGIIRSGDETKFKGPTTGTQYQFAVSVMREGDEAFLYGAAGEFNRAMYKSIVQTLRAQGIKTVRWERLNLETERPRKVDL